MEWWGVNDLTFLLHLKMRTGSSYKGDEKLHNSNPWLTIWWWGGVRLFMGGGRGGELCEG